MTITPDEINALYAPLPLSEHSIREGHKTSSGKIQWFVYVDRPTVQRRLDELFPGEWEFIYLDSDTSDEVTTVYAGIAIRGLRRDFNGTGKPRRSRNSDEEGIDENSPKSAMTDAFRRAASLWGIGAYLWDSPPIYTEGYPGGDWKAKSARENEAKQKFTDWYNNQFGNSGVARQNAAETPQERHSAVLPPAPVQPQATQHQRGQNPYGSQTAAQDEDVWQFSPTTEGALVMTVSKSTGHATKEVLNTVRKMADEGAFNGVTSAVDAADMVAARVMGHNQVEF